MLLILSFSLDRLLPSIQYIVTSHYKPTLYPESTKILQEMADVLWEFSERAIATIQNSNQLKVFLALILPVSHVSN